MAPRKKRFASAAGESDGIIFNVYGLPVDYEENRHAYGALRRCSLCRRYKPRHLYTPSEWPKGGSGYCISCRREDSRRRRILAEIEKRESA